MTLRNYILGLSSLFLTISGFAQKLLPSDPNFNFKEGIYFTLQDYKDNHPSITYNQLCDKNGKLLVDPELNNTVYYKNADGTIASIPKTELMGYAQKGNFYIKLDYNGTYFAKLVVIGSLSHFVCEVRTVSYGGYGYGQGTMTNYTLLQFLFDYDTGTVTNFNQESLTPCLQRDEELYTEYSLLPKRKKKDLMFLYLRKYNEKHPIYFPG